MAIPGLSPNSLKQPGVVQELGTSTVSVLYHQLPYKDYHKLRYSPAIKPIQTPFMYDFPINTY
jgi:hypothetical protein